MINDFELNRELAKFKDPEPKTEVWGFKVQSDKGIEKTLQYDYFGLNEKRFNQESANNMYPHFSIQYLGSPSENELVVKLTNEGLANEGFYVKNWYKIKERV